MIVATISYKKNRLMARNLEALELCTDDSTSLNLSNLLLSLSLSNIKQIELKFDSIYCDITGQKIKYYLFNIGNL